MALVMATLVLMSGVAWAQEAPVAVPVEDTPAEATAEPFVEPAPPPKNPPPVEVPPAARGLGTVVELDAGRPVIDRGSMDGLRVGDAVALYREESRKLGSGDLNELKLITTGKAVAVSQDAAIIDVGVNQIIPLGARAQKVAKMDSAHFLAPPRIGNQGYVHTEVRGLVSMSEAGGGAYAGAEIGYKLKLPLAFELRAAPIFMGLDNDIGVGKGSVVFIAAFDHHLFSFGLGGGVAINPEDVRPLFVQRLRIGAEDGLSIKGTLQLVQYPSSSGYASWGVDLNQVDVQMPLAKGRMPVWLLLRGMGGDFGGGGYVGAKFRVKGQGERGTVAIMPLIGGEVYNSGSTYLSGPGFGLAVDAAF